MPQAEEQLSLSTTTTELVLWSPGVAPTEPTNPRADAPQQEKPWQREAHTSQWESRPCSLQLEKSPRSNEDTAQQKIKEISNYNRIKEESILILR